MVFESFLLIVAISLGQILSVGCIGECDYRFLIWLRLRYELLMDIEPMPIGWEFTR